MAFPSRRRAACGAGRISLSETMLLLMQFARLFGVRYEMATDRDGAVSAMIAGDYMTGQTSLCTMARSMMRSAHS